MCWPSPASFWHSASWKGAEYMTTVTLSGCQLLEQRHTPCLKKLNIARSWGRTLAVRVGGLVIGIRASSEDTTERLDETFRTLRAPELDGIALPNFSVDLAHHDSGSRRGLHLVYRDHQIVARRRHPDEALRDLGELLEATTHAHLLDGLAMRGSLLVDDEGCGRILPWEWHAGLLLAQERLARAGHRLTVATTHRVETGTYTIARESQGALTFRTPERVPITSWALRSSFEEDTRMSRGQAIQMAFRTVVNVAGVGAAGTLQALERLSAGVPFIGLRRRTPAEHLRLAMHS